MLLLFGRMQTGYAYIRPQTDQQFNGTVDAVIEGLWCWFQKSAVAAAAVSVHCVCMFQRVCGQPLQINATIETTTSQGTFVIVSVFDILFRSCVRNVNARTIN